MAGLKNRMARFNNKHIGIGIGIAVLALMTFLFSLSRPEPPTGDGKGVYVSGPIQSKSHPEIWVDAQGRTYPPPPGWKPVPASQRNPGVE